MTRAQRHTFRAAKPLKNQLLLIERDALALINHADGDLRTLGVHLQINGAARFGIFDGIANQIFEALHQPIGITNRLQLRRIIQAIGNRIIKSCTGQFQRLPASSDHLERFLPDRQLMIISAA